MNARSITPLFVRIPTLLLLQILLLFVVGCSHKEEKGEVDSPETTFVSDYPLDFIDDGVAKESKKGAGVIAGEVDKILSETTLAEDIATGAVTSGEILDETIFYSAAAPVAGIPDGRTENHNCEPPIDDFFEEEALETNKTEETPELVENSFRSAMSSPYSTFSIDVDAASYTNIRANIERGSTPQPSIVRIEEMINFFKYNYAGPIDKHPFAFATQVAPCPWKPENRLVRIALQGRRVDIDQTPPSNLVFLIDVSGSMSSNDKLPLLKKSFAKLVSRLRPEDRVAIVTYAGNAGLVLRSTSGKNKRKILASLNRLTSAGSTAGAAGIMKAYDIAGKNFIEGGNNRVILATDGDFNVGVTHTKGLVGLLEEKRKEGVYLSVLGFGDIYGSDNRMEQIADNGNGNYYYIDRIEEGERVFGEGLAGTLLTIAKDVKLQIKFNPQLVAGYRLIGYENRVMAAKDFDNDAKDAGELGAGHSVTALYEVIPVGVQSSYVVDTTNSKDYEMPDAPPFLFGENDLLLARLRYKDPDGTESKLIEHLVLDRTTEIDRCDSDFRFAAAVASWGMILRGSPHAGSSNPQSVLDLANSSLGSGKNGERAEFVLMVEKWRKESLGKGSLVGIEH